MVNSEELIGTTEYLTLQTRCRLKRCRYNRVRLYFQGKDEKEKRYPVVNRFYVEAIVGCKAVR
jgi:hypothetical protein